MHVKSKQRRQTPPLEDQRQMEEGEPPAPTVTPTPPQRTTKKAASAAPSTAEADMGQRLQSLLSHDLGRPQPALAPAVSVPKTEREVMSAGAAGVAALLKRTDIDANLCFAGCQRLVSLTGKSLDGPSPGEFDQNAAAAARAAGAVEGVVVALATHPTDPKVQTWGCKALINLMANHNTHVCEEGPAQVLAAGGAVSMVAAMQAITARGCLGNCAITALYNMIGTPGAQAAAKAAGAAPAIEAALATHKQVVDVHKFGPKLLELVNADDRPDAAVLWEATRIAKVKAFLAAQAAAPPQPKASVPSPRRRRGYHPPQKKKKKKSGCCGGKPCSVKCTAKVVKKMLKAGGGGHSDDEHDQHSVSFFSSDSD
jgi:hypothetical protein